jgi:hypothetical protein
MMRILIVGVALVLTGGVGYLILRMAQAQPPGPAYTLIDCEEVHPYARIPARFTAPSQGQVSGTPQTALPLRCQQPRSDRAIRAHVDGILARYTETPLDDPADPRPTLLAIRHPQRGDIARLAPETVGTWLLADDGQDILAFIECTDCTLSRLGIPARWTADTLVLAMRRDLPGNQWLSGPRAILARLIAGD